MKINSCGPSPRFRWTRSSPFAIACGSADVRAPRCRFTRYMRHVAAQYLESVGTTAVPRLAFEDQLPGAGREAHTAIARRCWIWMVLALPQDLLLAALGGEQGPDRIELLSPAVARQLGDRGYAETHLHVGVALDFPLLWNAALRSLTLTQLALRHDAFKGPGAGLSEGQDLAPWLVRAALARYTLAAFFARRAPADGFERFLERDLFIDLAPQIGVAGFALLTEAIGIGSRAGCAGPLTRSKTSRVSTES